ncbi:hypothetical protein A3Q56_01540 [Intoshia linei]|uniref:WDR19 first beta-propeller domain-containing protein n=1 Tax=Intoshia linei TaxID=1819745 RepID=A0A177BAM3_9BILA|nr:hypothetical protein A3Q56_01540 [Intoshia linei]
MKKLFSIGKLLDDSHLSWQKSKSLFFAVEKQNKIIIYNRHGSQTHTIDITTKLIYLEWDNNDQKLIFMCHKEAKLGLWSIKHNNVKNFDLEFPETITCFNYSLKKSKLALGDVKGNILIVDTTTLKKWPIIGKHTKKITEIKWNVLNTVGCISDDKKLSISNEIGENVATINIGKIVKFVKFGCIKSESSQEICLYVSCIADQSLLIDKVEEPKNEYIKFDDAYGDIISYEWCENENIVVAFKNGYIVTVSAKTRMEMTTYKEFSYEIYEMAPSQDHLIIAGDNKINLYSIFDTKYALESYMLDEIGSTNISKLNVSLDGQLMSILTKKASMFIILVKLPIIKGLSNDSFVFLSSIREITIVDENFHECKIEVELEPSCISIFKKKLALCNDKTLHVYNIHTTESGDSIELSDRKICNYEIVDVRINLLNCAVLCADKTISLIKASKYLIMTINQVVFHYVWIYKLKPSLQIDQ